MEIEPKFDDNFSIRYQGGIYRRINGYINYWSGKCWKMCMLQNWTRLLTQGKKIQDKGNG